jgi:hypothetical protein
VCLLLTSYLPTHTPSAIARPRARGGAIRLNGPVVELCPDIGRRRRRHEQREQQDGEEEQSNHRSPPPVHLAPVPDPGDQNGVSFPLDLVEHPVLPDAQPEAVRHTLEGLGTGGHRVGREGIDPDRDPAHVVRELPEVARCRQLLAVPPAPPPGPPEAVATLLQRLTGVDLTRCPVCRQGRLRVVAVFGPGARPVLTPDTS